MTRDADKTIDDEKSLKELRNVILKANAVDAEYFTPVVSEYFESYNKKRKNQQKI